jgi:hypothetical protein
MRSLPLVLSKYWGAARWAKPLLDIVFDGVSSTVDYQLLQLLPQITGDCQRYYRFQPALGGHNHSLDNTSPANISSLKELAEQMIESESERLDELCEALTEGATSRSRKE